MLSLSVLHRLPEDPEKNLQVKERPQRSFKELQTPKDEIQHQKLVHDSEITVAEVVSFKHSNLL